MSKRILLFPGQGSQYVGMGEAMMTFPKAASLMAKANEVLGFDIQTLMLSGPEEELKKTENTQPALYIASQMAYSLLEANQFDYVAGHSLGEYSALAAAGVFSFEEGLKLVRIRGELMSQAGDKNPGAMSALLGLDAQVVRELVSDVTDGKVVVANYNSPSQIVISGDVSGVEAAEKLAQEKGAKKVVRLPVSGAFHSPLMDFAVSGLEEALDKVDFKEPCVPVITNVQAKPVTDPAELKNQLVKQLTSSVRWVECMEKAIELDCSQALELGAGRVLMGLLRAISRELKVFPIEGEQGLSKWKEAK